MLLWQFIVLPENSYWSLNSFLASGDFCHLLIMFANSLVQDQDWLSVGRSWSEYKLFDPLIFFLEKNFLKKLILKKKSADNNKHASWQGYSIIPRKAQGAATSDLVLGWIRTCISADNLCKQFFSQIRPIAVWHLMVFLKEVLKEGKADIEKKYLNFPIHANMELPIMYFKEVTGGSSKLWCISVLILANSADSIMLHFISVFTVWPKYLFTCFQYT